METEGHRQDGRQTERYIGIDTKKQTEMIGTVERFSNAAKH
jgi:hypothetical protein